MNWLWTLFIAGQIFSAGNMNYQQETGYWEINPIYGRHPSKEQVYLTKAIEIGLVYGATKVLPKHEKTILKIANGVCWGFIITDKMKGVNMRVRW